MGNGPEPCHIDVSPLIFETRDLETVDIKEYTQGYPEAPGTTMPPQTARAMPSTKNTRPKGNSPRTSARDPRLNNRRLSVTPVGRLCGTDSPRMADTTNVAQGLMETSADLDEEGKLVIDIP